MIRRLCALAALMFVLTACGLIPGGAPQTPAGAAPTATEPAPTLYAPHTPTVPAAGSEALPDEEAPLVLTVWTAEDLSPLNDTPGGQALLEQFTTFDQRFPDIRVDIYIKRASGAGSTLAYLRSAPSVAPAILPDLALLDREALAQAASEGLVVPIDTLIDPMLLEDMYPVALEMGAVDGKLVGLPYVLQVQHSVYRETLFQEPPSSFAAVLSSPVPFVFPAGTLGSVNRTTLLQYMAAGGVLVDEDGAPHLDSAALASVLNFYAAGRERGVIDTALFQIADFNDSWALYRSRQAGFAAVSSLNYLSERSEVRNTGVTWTPTPDGGPFTLATGWVWVVTTQDPDHQAAAMSLLNFLMNPVNLGTYTQASGWLPSQAGALAVWGDADSYTAIGGVLLENAVLLPDLAVRAAPGEAIQDAVEAVLLNGVSPFQAANEAAQKVNPPNSSAP